jgi:hypothetical protein
MDETSKVQFMRAMQTINPIAALVQVVLDLKAAGKSQAEVYRLFEQFLRDIAATETEAQKDAIRDVMDRIVGWCSPTSRLFDTYLQI